MFCVFLLVGRTLLHSEHPEHSELWMNSCSLPDYYRVSEPDKIFLGWRQMQAEGTGGGIYKAKTTHLHGANKIERSRWRHEPSVGGRGAGRETGPNVSPVRQGINQGGEDIERKSEGGREADVCVALGSLLQI